MEKNLLKKTYKGVFLKTIERVGLEGVSFIVSIVLARILMPEQYGNVSIILVLITLFDVVVNYGFSAGLIQKKDADSLDFSTCFYASFILTIVIYFALFVFSPGIAAFYNDDSLTWMIRILGIRIILSGVKSIYLAYVTKRFEFQKSTVSALVGSVLSGVLGIWMAFSGFGEWSLIFQYLSCSVINIICLLLLTNYFPLPIFSFYRLKTIFSFTWKLMALGFINALFDELRSLIIRKKYSSSDLAYYDKGRNLPKLAINNVNSVLDGVLFNSMSFLQDDNDKIKEMLEKSIKSCMYIATAISVGLFCVSNSLIIVLYTDKWIVAADYLRIFSIAYFFSPLTSLYMNALKSKGKSGLILAIDLLIKGLNLVLIIFAMFFGVKVIAITTIITNATFVLVYMIITYKLFSFGIIKQIKDIIISILPGISMGVIVYLLNYIGLSSLLTLIVQILVGVISFCILSFVFRNETFSAILFRIKKTK
jgi:O-antigen/teichoic acid export membrane protein